MSSPKVPRRLMNTVGQALEWLAELRQIEMRMEFGIASREEIARYNSECNVAWEAASAALAKAKERGFDFMGSTL